MNYCMFSSLGLGTCEPGFAFLSNEEKQKIRNHNLWRQDGMPAKPRKQSHGGRVLREADSCRKDYDDASTTTFESYYPSKQKHSKNNHMKHKRKTAQSPSLKHSRSTAQAFSKQNRKTTQSHSKQQTHRSLRKEEKANSYFSPRYLSSTVGENETNSTCPSTASSSSDSEESEWTRLTAGTIDSKITTYSWLQAYYDTLEDPEPEIKNVWSGDDDFSVGAVKANANRRVQEAAALSAQAGSVYNSAFSYIRKASQQFSNPLKDPPSDKSMVTTHSIRAEDAGSAVLRHGIMRRQQQRISELARAIQERKELEKAGTEP